VALYEEREHERQKRSIPQSFEEKASLGRVSQSEIDQEIQEFQWSWSADKAPANHWKW